MDLGNTSSHPRVRLVVALVAIGAVIIAASVWLAHRQAPTTVNSTQQLQPTAPTAPQASAGDSAAAASSSASDSTDAKGKSDSAGTASNGDRASVAPTAPKLPRFAVSCQVRAPAGNGLQQVVSSNPGRTICMNAGVHTLAAPLQLGAGQTLASAPGTWAILSGGRNLGGWVRDGQLWKTTVPVVKRDNDAAQCEDNVNNLCRIQNQLYLNGKHLGWVASKDKVQAGQAHLDVGSKTAYIAENPAGKKLIYSIVDKAIDSPAANVTVSNIIVEHFATPAQFGAVGVGPRSVVQGVEARFNHGAGVKLSYADSTVAKSNYLHDNGQLGLTQFKSEKTSLVNNFVQNNNTDGFWIADWESGGMKITESSANISANTVTGNKGVGIWCDIANHDIIISGNNIIGNAADGIRYEISKTGTIIKNVIRNNARGMGRGMNKSLWDGGGITVNTSEGMQILQNTLQGNMHGISLQARQRGEGPWGTYQFGNVTVKQNTIAMTDNEQTGFVADDGLAGRGSSITFTGNTYPTRSGTHWHWLGEMLNYTQWKGSHERG